MQDKVKEKITGLQQELARLQAELQQLEIKKNAILNRGVEIQGAVKELELLFPQK